MHANIKFEIAIFTFSGSQCFHTGRKCYKMSLFLLLLLLLLLLFFLCTKLTKRNKHFLFCSRFDSVVVYFFLCKRITHTYKPTPFLSLKKYIYLQYKCFPFICLVVCLFLYLHSFTPFSQNVIQ